MNKKITIFLKLLTVLITVLSTSLTFAQFTVWQNGNSIGPNYSTWQEAVYISSTINNSQVRNSSNTVIYERNNGTLKYWMFQANPYPEYSSIYQSDANSWINTWPVTNTIVLKSDGKIYGARTDGYNNPHFATETDMEANCTYVYKWSVSRTDWQSMTATLDLSQCVYQTPGYYQQYPAENLYIYGQLRNSGTAGLGWAEDWGFRKGPQDTEWHFTAPGYSENYTIGLYAVVNLEWKLEDNNNRFAFYVNGNYIYSKSCNVNSMRQSPMKFLMATTMVDDYTNGVEDVIINFRDNAFFGPVKWRDCKLKLTSGTEWNFWKGDSQQSIYANQQTCQVLQPYSSGNNANQEVITLSHTGSFTPPILPQPGCTTYEYNSPYPPDPYTPNCTGSDEIITAMGWAGEYSNVSVTNGTQYTFSSNITSDFITISAGTNVLAYGTTPVTWTANSSTIVRFYTHTNSSCGTSNTNRSRRVKCGTPCTAPIAPTGISVGTNPICSGNSTTLTATGGSTGSGCTYQWGTGSCGSNIISGQTGSSINVNPSTTTTYWVRRVGTISPCNTTTGCATVTVTVSNPPTAPTNITGTPTTINIGSSTTLTASGGSTGSGCTYQWGTGSCGSNIISGQTGSSINVSPSTTTTYWVRRVGNSPCNSTPTGCATGTVTVNPCTTPPNFDEALPTPTLAGEWLWVQFLGNCDLKVYRVPVVSGKQYKFILATVNDKRLDLYNSTGGLIKYSDNGTPSNNDEKIDYLATYNGFVYVKISGDNSWSYHFFYGEIPIPANDQCINAINLPCGETVSGTLTGASPTANITYDEQSGFNDVFYKFTAEYSGEHTITFTKSNPLDDFNVLLYSNCSSLDKINVIYNNWFNSSGIGSLTHFCEANTTYIIRVNTTFGDTDTGPNFTIKLDCPVFNVSPENWNFPAAGDIKEITVTTNQDWYFSYDSTNGWLDVYNLGFNTITMTAAQNLTTSSRSTTITVSTVNGMNKTITVSQDPMEFPNLELLSLSIVDPDPTYLYYDKPATFTATVINNGGAAYHSHLWVFIETENTHEDWQVIDFGVVQIDAGETTIPLTTTGIITVPVGMYVLNLVRDANNDPSNWSWVQFNNTLGNPPVPVLYFPPDNDLCTNAITLNCGEPKFGTLAGATPTTIYSDNGFNDVFYKFETEYSGYYTLTLTKNKPTDDIDLQVFSSCGSTERIADLFKNAIIETITFYCTAGTTYYIRTLDIIGSSGEFTIQLDCPTYNSWLIGEPNRPNVVASLINDTIFITGFGAMMDWGSPNPFYPPWNLSSSQSDMDHITSVVINSSVTTIGNLAFVTAHNLIHLNMPNTITSIGVQSFYNCLKLPYIDIPSGVDTIKEAAFSSCYGAEWINIPKSVTYIGESAFGVAYGSGNSSKLKDVYVEWSNPLSIPENTFFEINVSNVNLHVPPGTECLYHEADVWKDFNIVGFPLTITATITGNGSISQEGIIEVNCFESVPFTFTPDDCSEISQIFIDGIPISDYPFSELLEIGYLTIGDPSSTFTFTNITANHTIEVTFEIKTYTITAIATGNGTISPSGTTTLNCGNDTIFKITPDECYGISEFKVDGKLTVPDSINVAENSYYYTFENVIENHTIEVTFTNSWEIGQQPYPFDVIATFENEILTISGYGKMKDFDQGWQQLITTPNCPPWCSLFCPIQTVNIGENITYIGTNAFRNFGDIETVNFLPTSNVETIGAHSFRGSGIKCIELPNSVTTINDDAFRDCGSLSCALIIPNSVTTIGDRAFIGCHSVDSLILYCCDATFGIESFGRMFGLSDLFVHCNIPPVLTEELNIFTAMYLYDINLHVPPGTECLYHTAPVWEEFNTVGLPFTITATATGNGIIAPAGTIENVECGDEITFTLSPDYCYEIDEVIIDGFPISYYPISELSEIGYLTIGYPSSTFTFTNITGNHTIEVIFKPENGWFVGAPYKEENVTAFYCDGTLTISGTGEMMNFDPDNTEIGLPPWDFLRPDITTVIFEGDITHIGAYSFFQHFDFETVTFPNSLISIGAHSFQECISLSDLNIPETVTTISEYAFAYTHFSFIIIPESVDYIGNFAFAWIYDLADVTVYWDEPLSPIFGNTFENPNIANINLHVPLGTECVYAATPVWQDFNILGLPSITATVIGNGSISQEGTVACGEDVTYYFTPNNCSEIDQIFIDDIPISDYPISELSEIGYLTIGDPISFTFTNITGIHTIEVTFTFAPLPLTITATATGNGSILQEGETFCGEDITFTFIPENCYEYEIDQISIDGIPISDYPISELSEIGYLTIGDPSSFTFTNITENHTIEVIFKPENGWPVGKSDEDDVFAFYCDGTLTISGKGKMKDFEPGNTQWINFNYEIIKLIIGDGITHIGTNAFRGCELLSDTLNIPNSVISIGEYAFYNTNYSVINIPCSVDSIGDYAFVPLISLSDVFVCWETPLEIPAHTFYTPAIQIANLHVPPGTECKYDAAPVWQEFKIIGLPLEIESTAGYNGTISPTGIFQYDCGDEIIYEIIPEECYEIDEISIDGIPISDYLISELSQIGYLTIGYPNSTFTFTDITANHTISVTFTPFARSWDIGAFISTNVTANLFDCATTLTISGEGDMKDFTAGTTLWDSWRFDITTVNIEEGVTNIGNYAFLSHENLPTENLYLPQTLISIGEHSFRGCYNLTDSLSIPESVTTIGNSAFYSTSYSNVFIPESVTHIGEKAFGWMFDLEDVYVEWLTPLGVPENTFYYLNTSTINLHVPPGTECDYAIFDVWKDFNIIKSNGQTITFELPSSVTYGCEVITLPETSDAGLPITYLCDNVLVAEIDSYTLMIKGAGTAIITAIQEGNCEYNAADSISLPFIVNKAPLCITANDTTRLQYQPNPEFTYYYEGFVCDEDESVLDEKPIISCEAGFDSPPDTYPIIFDYCPVDKNYEITCSCNPSGTLTVVSAEWYIGAPEYDTTVIAKLTDGTLTITGNDNMMDFNFDDKPVPWNLLRSLIKSVEIADGVTSVGDHAFRDCESLENLTLANTISSIGNSSFWGCNLDTLKIPVSVNFIGKDAFTLCRNLIFVEVFWTEPLGNLDTPFAGVDVENVELKVPCGTQNEYCTSDVWMNFHINRCNPNNDIPENLCEYLKSEINAGHNPIELPQNTIGAELPIHYEICNGNVAIISPDYKLYIMGTGTISICATQSGDCVYYAAIPVTCDLDVTTVGIDENITQQISIYPNPAQTEIFIKTELQIEQVKIYSITGSLLIRDDHFNEKLSVSALAPGFYLVYVYTEKGVMVSKVVKQ